MATIKLIRIILKMTTAKITQMMYRFVKNALFEAAIYPSSSSLTSYSSNKKFPREASTTVRTACMNVSNLSDSETKLMFPTRANPRQIMQ
jgi:hypothetical protein